MIRQKLKEVDWKIITWTYLIGILLTIAFSIFSSETFLQNFGLMNFWFWGFSLFIFLRWILENKNEIAIEKVELPPMQISNMKGIECFVKTDEGGILSIDMSLTAENINQLIQQQKANNPNFSAKEISDGYHTIQELYDSRFLLTELLFNEWVNTGKIASYNVHKSKRDYYGKLCFGGTYFIVIAMLTDGEISNYYKMEDWDLFDIPETEKAIYPFDGHNTQDVIERMKSEIETGIALRNADDLRRKKLLKNFKAPFRLGKKQKRAILDRDGKEVIILHKGEEYKEVAAAFLEFLNE